MGRFKWLLKALVLLGLFRKIEVCSLLCNVSESNNSAAHSGVVSACINH